jgi:hypothetical protein
MTSIVHILYHTMSKKRVRFYIVPLFLLMLWVVLSLYYIFYLDFSFTILTSYHPKSVIQNYNTKELLAGQKITGEVQGIRNYLALVSIRFHTFERDNNDMLTLRIKEKGQQTWYNETTFRTTLSNNEFYHFGFAPIADSKGKTYIFEIESFYGKKGNAVGLSNIEPLIGTKYQLPKSMIINNKSALIEFTKLKIHNIVENNNIIYPLFVFLLPFLCYTLMLVSEMRKQFVFKYIAISLFFLAIIGEIIFKGNSNDLILLTLISIYVYFIHINKFNSKVAYYIGFFLLVIASVIFSVNVHSVQIKLVSWALFFFIIGTIQNLTLLYLQSRNDKK